MAINKKLIHFNKKSDFESEVAKGNILNYSICFIADTKEIYTHGNYYNRVSEAPVSEAPIDGLKYIRVDGAWYVLSTSSSSTDGLMSSSDKTKLDGIESGALKNTVLGVKGNSESSYRTGNINITKTNIGLGNVDNTSDLSKPISTATQKALDGKVDKIAGKGLSTEDFTGAYKTVLDNLPTNYAPLVDGLVPAANLPSYVDDVIEAKSKNKFPTTGESGKIYVALDTNLTYRWGGTEYVEISKSLALGETANTAYAGNKGAANATAIATHTGNTNNPHGVTKSQVGLGNVDNTSDLNKPISTATQSALDGKVDKVSGKGLSANDFTTEEKNKLAGIAAGANNYTLPQASGKTLGGVKVGSNITVSSGTISMTKDNVTAALGYVPPTQDTNTHYESKTITGASSTATANAAASNGNVYMNHIENGAVKSSHNIKGSGATTVTSDANGVITVNSTNTTYGVATQRANGLMSSTDKTKLDGVETGAQKNTITGIKGNAETSYRKGNVNLTLADIGAAAASHTHSIGNVTNLQTTLDGKAAVNHNHTISQITNLQATLDGKAAASHTHAIADITNISSASVSYASSAGNADTLDGNHASAFATAGHTHSYIPTSASCNKNWAWSGQSGQPSWLWGSNDGSNCYVWNPSNFRVNYASSAGNADTVDGEHSSAFAHIGAHNNLIAAGNEFTFVPSGFSGDVLINYRTAGGYNGNITEYKLCNGNGRVFGTIIHTGNIGSQSVNYASSAGHASSAGNADTLDGYHYSSFAWASHSHSYLPLSGGTMSGMLSFNSAGSEHIEMRTNTTGKACAFSMGYTNGNAWSIGVRANGEYGIWFYNTIRNIDSHRFYPSGSLTISGSLSQSSDMRLKNVLSDMQLDVNSIAQAPLFQFTYTYDSGNRHVGTSAQYWDAVYRDYFTKDDGKYLSIEYQNLGVAMGISLAREIVKYESKTDEKIRLMKEKINVLEKANESLEARVKELEERMTA